MLHRTRTRPGPGSQATAVAALAFLLGAASPARAAAPEDPIVPGGGKGHASAPLQQRITTVSVALDVRTGAWMTIVRFATPRSPRNAADLRLDLVFPDDVPGGTTASILLRTDPGAPEARFERASSPGRPAAPGAGIATATFAPDGSSVTVRVTDPTLAGRPRPREVDGSISSDGDPGETYDDFIAVMGPKSPTPTIPARARRLTVSRTGHARIRLAALPVPARRYVALRIGRNQLDALELPSRASGARTVRLRVPCGTLRSLPVGRLRRARLSVTAGLDYGRPTRVEVPVTLRRR
ncbi:hypothetical protein AB0L40_27435 [Patulibacter sp. NPDC049589]|uniref:hypothetical protein n=1 Tax=Patulibacter sp. NPDC049589 TaxID=3154731 RepID=UPI003442998E